MDTAYLAFYRKLEAVSKQWLSFKKDWH
jgi:hypothetical protein